MLPELKQAVEAGDWAKIESIGHRLRGSSSNISAVEFAAECQQLRDRAEQHDPVATMQLVSALESEFQRIVSWLEAHQKNNL